MGVLLGSQPGLPALAFGSVIEKARASLPWLPHMTATWASLQTRSTHMTLSGTLGSALCTARTGNSLDDLHNFRCFSSPPVSVNSSFFYLVLISYCLSAHVSGVKFCWFVRGAKDICLWTGGSHDPNRSKKVLNLMGLLLGACFVFFIRKYSLFGEIS